jgi:acetoin utilization deacetylase AcuC-like enzyme
MMETGSSADGAVAWKSTSRRQFLSRALAGAALTAIRTNALLAGQKPAGPDARLPTALVYDEICKCHVAGPDEPECPQRYDAVLGALTRSGDLAAFRPFKSRPATEAEILACHADAYVARIRREIDAGATRLSTGDTYVCHDSLKAAYHASGAACVAVEAVLTGQAKNAFCLTRPPGHHATPDRGMGFCIFNNVAIATRYAQRKHGIGKVLIIDWDVHHGNGTQDIFYDDGSVFYFSTHQAPWYPWTGAADETGRAAGLGCNLNCPLNRGAGRSEFLAAFQDKLLPAAKRFKPELIMISAGFDARHGDPLGRLELTDQDYSDLTALILEFARERAQGRVVSVLEGGYRLEGLASAATAHCHRLQQGAA